MRIPREQWGRLARRLLQDLESVWTPTADREAVATALSRVLYEEFTVEERLEQEVRSLLEAYEKEIQQGRIDRGRMLQLIKQRLVQERGVVLARDRMEKINLLSHRVLEVLQQKGVLQEDPVEVLRRIKQRIQEAFRLEEEADAFARRRLAAYRQPPPEGSPAWNLLYRRFYQEYLQRRHPTPHR